MIVLGIDTSCDDTGVGITRDGEVLANVVVTQTALHARFGGVVPEEASREHLEVIDRAVADALERAGVSLSDLDAVGATYGPGLVGALLVGLSYAKTLAWGLDLPLVPVHHLEGHLAAADGEPPFLALIASGGHTALFRVESWDEIEELGHSRDDAAGEAFDKAAKMLGLGYPGGPIIEKIALDGDAKKIHFPTAKISDGRPDMSFSGLKTALVRHVRENSVSPANGSISQEIKDIAASFQRAVIRGLMKSFERLASDLRPKSLIVAGGVACNLALCSAADDLAAKLGVPVYFPSKHLSTDNAAMIAAAGYFHLMRGERADLDLAADVTLRLQNSGNAEAEAGRRGNYRR